MFEVSYNGRTWYESNDFYCRIYQKDFYAMLSETC